MPAPLPLPPLALAAVNFDFIESEICLLLLMLVDVPQPIAPTNELPYALLLAMVLALHLPTLLPPPPSPIMIMLVPSHAFAPADANVLLQLLLPSLLTPVCLRLCLKQNSINATTNATNKPPINMKNIPATLLSDNSFRVASCLSVRLHSASSNHHLFCNFVNSPVSINVNMAKLMDSLMACVTRHCEDEEEKRRKNIAI